MPKITEMEVFYSRNVKLVRDDAFNKEYEEASARLKAVFNDGEQNEADDLSVLGDQCIDEVERMLGIKHDDGAKAEVSRDTTSAEGEKVADPSSSAGASAVTSGRRPSGASAQAPASSATTASTGRRSSGSTTTAVEPAEAAPEKPASGRRPAGTPSATTQTAPAGRRTQTSAGTKPSPSEPAPAKDEGPTLQDVLKACGVLADKEGTDAVLAWLGDHKDAKGEPVVSANGLQKKDYKAFIDGALNDPEPVHIQ